MRARSLALTFALAHLLGWPAPASAQDELETEDPRLRLRDAENSYLYGDYARVTRTLTPLVEPDIRLVAANDQARAYELLGLAHFFLDDPTNARKFFSRLVQFRPDFRINPVLVPPHVVAFFDEVRASLEAEIEATRAELRRQREAEEEARRRASVRELYFERRVNSRFVAAMPLGIGQFQNGDAGLGTLFLGAELLSAGLSVGFFLAVEDLRQPDGLFARDDVARARALQTAQLISGGIALGVTALGIAQALWAFDEDAGVRALDGPPGLGRDLGPAPLAPPPAPGGPATLLIPWAVPF